MVAAGPVALHDVLVVKRDEVLRRWKTQVQGTLAPEAMPTLEILDHIPEFLDEIVAALRADAGVLSVAPPSKQSKMAATHGAQRLRLGFSLDAVVREYGALRHAIVAAASDDAAALSLRELEVLVDCIVNGIASAVTEYTQRRDAEFLRQANEHFAFIAHELRNPLSSAAVALELLKNGGALPTESRSVRALESGLRRTTELIEQTLRIARVASGVELRRQSTTLKAICAEVELAARAEAESKGVELRIAIDDEEEVRVDERLVRSALGNLLRNAVKYSASGKVVELRGRTEDKRVVIEVQDGCGGLEPGKVEQAFAPFVRLDAKQTGFGLGLAIAKQAIDAHGGTIRVQNLPGTGCIFVLELPTE
jgi:signal transduction histidine kinase